MIRKVSHSARKNISRTLGSRHKYEQEQALSRLWSLALNKILTSFFIGTIIKDHMSSSITIVNERLTFSELVGAMERGGAIKEVILEDVVIEGDEDAMRLLTRYFRGHYTIENAVFRRVSLADETNDLGIIFSTLLVSACELKHFHVEECPVSSAVLICVSYSPNLESLRLINCNLGDGDATKLVDVLAKATSVTVLDLSGNGFSAIGESALKTGLERSSNISSLMIDGHGVVLAKAPKVKVVSTKQISAQTA